MQQIKNDSVTMKLAKGTQIGMKFGSLQLFCNNIGAVENYSSDNFHRDEVHKIAVLDLRILNLDRNEQNILVKVRTRVSKVDGVEVRRKVNTLVPIDHGLCIPDNLAICTFDIAWLSWRQASLKFSARTKKYIAGLRFKKDIKILERTFKFRPICLRNIRISTTLL